MSPAVRILHRGALFACYAAVVALVVGGSVSWLGEARLGRPTIVFDYARMLEKRLPAIAAAREHAYTVAVLGDSALVSYPEGRSVPEQLAREVERSSVGGPEIDVHSLGMSGTGPFDYYFLTDRIAAARPHLVVIALNLDHFSESWQGAYSRPQLAGLIAADQLPEALSLPLFFAGLTTDRLLFYNGVVGAGGYEPWYWLTLRQAQVGRARERFERWIGGSPDYLAHEPASATAEEFFRDAASARTIDRLFTGDDLHRYRVSGLREHYAIAVGGVTHAHPVLRALAASLRRFRDAGVDTLVYVVPADVAYMKALGVLDSVGLARTLAAVDRVVVDSGGTFVDLHDALPTQAFRDAPGHLVYAGHARYDGELDGPIRLAEQLAPHVLARARAAAANDTGASD